MEKTLFGVPYLVWFFIVILGLIIGVPMYTLHQREMHLLTVIESDVAPTPTSTVLPTVTASPSATPTVMPTVRTYAPVYRVAPTVSK